MPRPTTSCCAHARSSVGARRATRSARSSCCSRALALDSRFALAWNVLGNALTSLLTFGPDNPQELRKQIEDALGRSVALAPDLWTGHEAHANLLELRHDWVGAEQANARARNLAPKSMREPVVSRSHQLAAVGRIHEAIPFAPEATRIEPLAPLPTLAELLFYLGPARGIAARVRARTEVGQQPFRVRLLACGRMMAIGDHAKAKRCLALAAAGDPSSSSLHRELLDVFDDPTSARALIRSCVEAPPQRGDFARLTAVVRYAPYFGEHELALAAYRRIAKQMLGVIMINFWSPLLAEMRKLPGFKDLVPRSRARHLLAARRGSGVSSRGPWATTISSAGSGSPRHSRRSTRGARELSRAIERVALRSCMRGGSFSTLVRVADDQ